MEPISTIISAALGYILKAAADSKTVTGIKEDMLQRFWHRVRPQFIKDVPELEDKPDDPAMVTQAARKLFELIKVDKAFFEMLVQEVSILQQAGIKEKNIVEKNIIGEGNVWIGDELYRSDTAYDRKNIVEGDVNVKGDFRLGDKVSGERS